MRRYARTRWVGACLLGAALGAAGCSDSVQRQPAACCDRFTIHPAGAPDAGPADKAPAPSPGADARPAVLPPPDERGATITTVTPVPAAAVTAPPGSRFPDGVTVLYGPGQAPQGTPVASRPQGPSRHRQAQILNASAAPPPAGALGRPAEAPPVQSVTYKPDAAFSADVPRRRGYVDLTIQPWFGCADDHSWLSGQLLYARATNTWRLHYASVDDNDPYGGTVTLVGGRELNGLADGQYVRVNGCPVDPDRREADAPYRVTSYQLVEHLH